MEGYKYSMNQNNKLQIMIPQEQVRSPEQPLSEGIIPRSIRELFRQVEEKKKLAGPGHLINVSCTYIQLYNEKIYDLLNSDVYKNQVNGKKKLDGAHGLKLKWSPNDEVVIENVFCFECHSAEEALKYFWKGLKNKMMSSHNMNNSSSRSHCILCFNVQQIDSSNPDSIIVSRLQLVDLAGSERQSHAQTNKDPVLMKESIEINKSLFTLRQVITALTEKSQNFTPYSTSMGGQFSTYIPYRESKLTSILRQSLGGNSYCLMLACLTPLDDYLDENISTLNYASRASHISNIPTINQDPKLKLINEQRKAIERLQQELKRANDQIKFLTGQIDGKQGGGGGGLISDTESNGGVTINNNYNSNVIAIINGQDQQLSNTSMGTTSKSFEVSTSMKSRQQQIGRDQQIQGIPSLPSQPPSTIQTQQTQNTTVLPELRSTSRMNQANSSVNNSQSIMDQMHNKHKQMHTEFQDFFQNKQESLKNLSASIGKMPQKAQLVNHNVTDRLIYSINMIKEVLQSNMQLREEMLKLTQDHEKTQLQNFQFSVENEDLRDKLALLTNDDIYSIQYQAYLPSLNIEKLLEEVVDKKSLIQAKYDILSNIFSLRKENRTLQQRIGAMEQYQGRQQKGKSGIKLVDGGQMQTTSSSFSQGGQQNKSILLIKSPVDSQSSNKRMNSTKNRFNYANSGSHININQIKEEFNEESQENFDLLDQQLQQNAKLNKIKEDLKMIREHSSELPNSSKPKNIRRNLVNSSQIREDAYQIKSDLAHLEIKTLLNPDDVSLQDQEKLKGLTNPHLGTAELKRKRIPEYVQPPMRKSQGFSSMRVQSNDYQFKKLTSSSHFNEHNLSMSNAVVADADSYMSAPTSYRKGNQNKSQMDDSQQEIVKRGQGIGVISEEMNENNTIEGLDQDQINLPKTPKQVSNKSKMSISSYNLAKVQAVTTNAGKEFLMQNQFANIEAITYYHNKTGKTKSKKRMKY